jgi:hypothetical protein
MIIFEQIQQALRNQIELHRRAGQAVRPVAPMLVARAFQELHQIDPRIGDLGGLLADQRAFLGGGKP